MRNFIKNIPLRIKHRFKGFWLLPWLQMIGAVLAILSSVCGLWTDGPGVTNKVSSLMGLTNWQVICATIFIVSVLCIWLAPHFVKRSQELELNAKVIRFADLLKRMEETQGSKQLKASVKLKILERIVRVESRIAIKNLCGKVTSQSYTDSVEEAFKTDGLSGAIAAGREFLETLKTKEAIKVARPVKSVPHTPKPES